VAAADLVGGVAGAADADVARPPGNGHTGGAGAHLGPVGAEPVGHGVGDVRVLDGQQPLGSLNERDPGAEAAEHLGELAADVAAAHHHEVLGELGEVQQGPRGVVRDPAEPFDRRDRGAHPGDQEDPVRLQLGVLHPQPSRADEPALRRVVVHRLGALHRPVRAVPDRLDDLVLAGDHRGQVDHRVADPHPELGRPPHLVRHLRRGDHRLGGDAPAVEAGAAQLLLLHERHAAVPRRAQRQRQTGHATADHQRLIALDHPVPHSPPASVVGSPQGHPRGAPPPASRPVRVPAGRAA